MTACPGARPGLRVVAVAVLVLMAAALLRPRTPAVPLDVHRPIALNTATAAELRLLPGIGPSLAARIVEDRQRHGPYDRFETLARVPGIGPATLRRLEPLTVLEPSAYDVPIQ